MQTEQVTVPVEGAGPRNRNGYQWSIGALRSPDNLRRAALYQLRDYRPTRQSPSLAFPPDVLLSDNLA